MSMTKSRRRIYWKNWYHIESQVDKRNRRKELNKKVRRTKDIPGGKCGYRRLTCHWNTVS
jgi:hypothetical protein